jgi:hypothetical protein
MIRKILLATVLLTPLLTFAQGNGHAYAYGHAKHAPEIDGSNLILGIALLGGILSLTKRRGKK